MDWWPLDPQFTKDRLQNRGYIPLGEERSYEAEAEDYVVRLQLNSREVVLWQPFFGAKIYPINVRR